MNKSFIKLILCLFIFIFVGCNKESQNILDNNSNISFENKTIQGVLTESNSISILPEGIISDETVQLKSAGVWDGPFYIQPDIVKSHSRVKMTIPSGLISGIVTGNYIVDVYTISKTVKLPTNTIAQVYLPNPCGYKNYNTKEIGLNYTQSLSTTGNSLYMQTFTMVILCNISGQTLNRAWPCSRYNITFSYSTMTY